MLSVKNESSVVSVILLSVVMLSASMQSVIMLPEKTYSTNVTRDDRHMMTKIFL
jgi:hypothetical protein